MSATATCRHCRAPIWLEMLGGVLRWVGTEGWRCGSDGHGHEPGAR
ncbi:MAG: hypothetical protein J2P57_04915 [Acidimicrobiaceae bacterium]|nr:hypothetical protein [Acidimicrobiaceae bacterium]